jgi:hypothetical protein
MGGAVGRCHHLFSVALLVLLPLVAAPTNHISFVITIPTAVGAMALPLPLKLAKTVSSPVAYLVATSNNSSVVRGASSMSAWMSASQVVS